MVTRWKKVAGGRIRRDGQRRYGTEEDCCCPAAIACGYCVDDVANPTVTVTISGVDDVSCGTCDSMNGVFVLDHAGDFICAGTTQGCVWSYTDEIDWCSFGTRQRTIYFSLSTGLSFPLLTPEFRLAIEAFVTLPSAGSLAEFRYVQLGTRIPNDGDFVCSDIFYVLNDNNIVCEGVAALPRTGTGCDATEAIGVVQFGEV